MDPALMMDVFVNGDDPLRCSILGQDTEPPGEPGQGQESPSTALCSAELLH